MIFTRLSIRARLSIAFAAALLAVLVLAGAFVYVRVGSDLSSALNDSLRSRSDDLEALLGEAKNVPAQLEAGPASQINLREGFSEVLSPSGRVIATTLSDGSSPVLDAAQVELAGREPVIVERKIPGVEGDARIFARPAHEGGRRVIVVVGTSTDDRREALDALSRDFVIGAPLALLLAAGLGYALAGRSLAPVDAMRRRAARITTERSSERLPLPHAEDEIHQLGQTLNTMLDRLEAGLERERVFISDASHELRTPLAILKAELEMADSPGRSEAELRVALHSAREEIDRLSQLAEDLLVIARSDEGKLPIASEPVELRALLERVRGRFAHRAENEGRRLVIDASADLVASVDSLRIEQALANLLDNALRHGAGDVHMSARRQGASIVLEVSDQGTGFAPGFEGEAFDRFTRSDVRRGGDGAGLGLAIVRAIAEAHGGQVSVTGRPDEPTILRLTLPAKAA